LTESGFAGSIAEVIEVGAVSMTVEHPLNHVIEFEVRRVWKKLPLGSYDFDDLMHFGYLGLLEAEARFDPDQGVQLASFAKYRIRGAILDGIRTGLGPYGRRHYDGLRKDFVAQANAARTTSDTEKGPEVTRQDVTFRQASDLNNTLLGAHPAMPVAMDAETALGWDQELSVMHQALNELNTLERKVLRAMYDLSLRDDSGAKLAKRMGLHRAQISRRHKSAMSKLRSLMRKIRRQTIDK